MAKTLPTAYGTVTFDGSLPEAYIGPDVLDAYAGHLPSSYGVLSPAVSMTAGEGTGIVVADGVQVNPGANDFTLALSTLNPDYSPASEQWLYYKYQDANNYWGLRVKTSGLLNFIAVVASATILDIDSTAAIGATDGSLIQPAFSLSRESTGSAGAGIFTVNGVQLGTTVSITAGTPASIDNTGDLYINGTDATRNESFTTEAVIINGALTSGMLFDIYSSGNFPPAVSSGVSPGGQGFGVGICPLELPSGMSAMSGYDDPSSANYGNYEYSDGSIMCWIPAFFYKYGTGANGLSVNEVDIKYFSDYPCVGAANADGYALHRAFYNSGAVQSGVFVDKYLCSNNSGTASSIALGNPLSSSAAHNPFGGLTGAPANTYYGAIDSAKTRGAGFFCNSLFIFKALALLSLAHANASSNTTYCAWYDATYNFPKGCNNNALGDANDASLSFTSDGYSTACKTGSANLFAKTTHNGQACGVADLNGCMWEITPGLTASGSATSDSFYVLKTSADMSAVTSGASIATDLWGAAGRAALYDDLGAMSAFSGYALNFSDRFITYGSASQVLSEATSGTAWQMAGAGVPFVSGGTNQFGSDGIWDYSTGDMCPIVGGNWADGATAGVWALSLSNARTNSNGSVGFRAALYLTNQLGATVHLPPEGIATGSGLTWEGSANPVDGTLPASGADKVTIRR